MPPQSSMTDRLTVTQEPRLSERAAPAGRGVRRTTAGERLLIVEDESIVQLHLQEVLVDLGYSVIGVAASRAEALECALRLEPDLVLMDIRLEDGDDGIETAREIRQRHGIPVVFLTAYADERTIERAKAIEPAGYIVKPFNEKALQATIATALQKHRAVLRIEEHGEWLATILNSLSDGVIVTDAEGRVTLTNGAADALTGYAAEAAVGRSVLELCSFPEQREAETVAELVRGALGEGLPGYVAVVCLTDSLGQQRAVEVTVTPLDHEEREGLVLILRDESRRREAESQLASLRRLLTDESHFHGMIGHSEEMETVYSKVREVASVDWTVLIEGETGTGKELVARAIHAEGHRSSGPFVPVNAAGLTESLLASQLFGHTKGAFTGATSNQSGLFDAADGGTLFLDEIGDVPPSVQASLLRVLEDRAVTPLGTTRSHTVDVRFLAATHRDLGKEVEAGRFRADLLYRLRVARIQIPPLRDRGGDLEALANWFLARAGSASGKHVTAISDESWRRLREYSWPGNVREFRSAIECAVMSCQGSIIEPSDLPPELGAVLALDPRAAIVDALERCGGNRTAAAQLLGVSRSTFYRRLAQLGLDSESS